MIVSKLKRSSVFLPLGVMAAIYVLLSAFSPPGQSTAQFRPHMRSVYTSLIKVMSFLLVDSENIAAKERKSLEANFKNLAEQAKAIQALAGQSDKGHQILSAELVKDTQAALSAFKAGKASQTRFYLSDIVSTCFNCHTSRGSATDSQFAVDFQKDVHWNDFDPLAKARFLALSRQFEAASQEYERLFLSNSLSSDQLINYDPFVEYMLINIRVRNKPEAIVETLSKLRLDRYPQLVRKDLEAWQAAVKLDTAAPKVSNQLEQAKAYFQKAKEAMEYPRDRSVLVHYIFASRSLQDYLRIEGLDAAQKAETYYLLGICELAIGTNLFADESLAYFEEVIRLQPKTALARKAFAQLEETVLVGYTGSSGLHLPEAEKRKFEELKKLAF